MDQQSRQALRTCWDALIPLNHAQAIPVVKALRQYIPSSNFIRSREHSSKTPSNVPDAAIGVHDVDHAPSSMVNIGNQGSPRNYLKPNPLGSRAIFPARGHGFQAPLSVEGPSNPLGIRKRSSLALEDQTKFPGTMALAYPYRTGPASDRKGPETTDRRPHGKSFDRRSWTAIPGLRWQR